MNLNKRVKLIGSLINLKPEQLELNGLRFTSAEKNVGVLGITGTA